MTGHNICGLTSWLQSWQGVCCSSCSCPNRVDCLPYMFTVNCLRIQTTDSNTMAVVHHFQYQSVKKCLSVHQPISHTHTFIYLSTNSFVPSYIQQLTYSSIHPSIHPSSWLFKPHNHQSIRPSIHPSIHPSIQPASQPASQLSIQTI
jgi:hypothetical protein